MAKNRRKKRRKQRDGQASASRPQLPRPSRAHDRGAEASPDAAVASPPAKLSMPHQVGEVVSATVTDIDDDNWLSLDVGGWGASIPPWELSLNDEESAQERYTVGETIDSLLVLWVNHETRNLGLSAKRNALSYVEALQPCSVGDVVSGTISHVDDGLWLDVDGWGASVAPDELALADRESAQDRYATGETAGGLLVYEVNHKARHLALSAKRNTPGYIEALQRRSVGDVVSATITALTSDGGLMLEVEGLVGSVGHHDLALGDRKSAWDRYAVGETISGLFVWGVDHETRRLTLSTKRNTPGYLEALQRRPVGDVVSGTVTVLASNGGLWLDVDGLAR